MRKVFLVVLVLAPIISTVSANSLERIHFKKDYSKGCSKEYKVSQNACSCAFDVAEKLIGYQTIKDADNEDTKKLKLFKGIEQFALNNQCRYL
jgi:hypothetical protein